MKELSQKICDENWQRDNLCKDTCPLASSCEFQLNDNYWIWQTRMEIAAEQLIKESGEPA